MSITIFLICVYSFVFTINWSCVYLDLTVSQLVGETMSNMHFLNFLCKKLRIKHQRLIFPPNHCLVTQGSELPAVNNSHNCIKFAGKTFQHLIIFLSVQTFLKPSCPVKMIALMFWNHSHCPILTHLNTTSLCTTLHSNKELKPGNIKQVFQKSANK